MSTNKVQYRGKRFTLIGESTDAFQDTPQFLLSAGLNMSDPEAIEINAGLPALDLEVDGGASDEARPKVVLLKNAHLAEAPDTLYANALVVPVGAAIEFVFGCKTPVGFGFALNPTGESKALDGQSEIVTRLYGVEPPAGDGYRYEVVRRFQNADARLLIVDPAAAYQGGTIKSEDRVQRWVLQASAWEVKSFIDPVSSMVYSATRLPKAPPAASAGVAPRRAGSMSVASASGAMSAPVSLMSLDGVSPGVLVGRDASTQTFSHIRVLEEGGTVGALTLTLFIV